MDHRFVFFVGVAKARIIGRARLEDRLNEIMVMCSFVYKSRGLNRLAKQFADAIPPNEFSVAALQGCKYFHYVS